MRHCASRAYQLSAQVAVLLIGITLMYSELEQSPLRERCFVMKCLCFITSCAAQSPDAITIVSRFPIKPHDHMGTGSHNGRVGFFRFNNQTSWPQQKVNRDSLRLQTITAVKLRRGRAR